MTVMNNEDPADPGVHEPRELPEPAAIAAERERRCPGLPDPHCNYLATCCTICNKCGRQHAGSIPPKWWTCPTHGDAQPNAWGCPECVREMRGELVTHAALELEQAERIAELEARLKEIGDYAHDLLDALQDILTVVRMAECYDEYQAAEAAIAKARKRWHWY